MISASIMAANMWKNSLKTVESDSNKILYETLLDFFYSETVLTSWISLVLVLTSVPSADTNIIIRIFGLWFLLKYKLCQLCTFLVAWRVALKVAFELLSVYLHLAAGVTRNGFMQLCMEKQNRIDILQSGQYWTGPTVTGIVGGVYWVVWPHLGRNLLHIYLNNTVCFEHKSYA